jgi:hypothetical protein
MTDTDTLIRRLIGGDREAAARIADRARTSDEPVLLVAAALADPAARDLLNRATELASTTRDRQLTAIATAHLAGDTERVDALARDHLADHPGSLLVAWIAAGSTDPEGTPS